MIRFNRPPGRQLKTVSVDILMPMGTGIPHILMPKGRGIQAEVSTMQAKISPTQVQSSKAQAIALLTKWLTMRDLEVLVAPKCMPLYLQMLTVLIDCF